MRSSVEWIRNTLTPSGQWQDLKVRISGAKVEGYLNGKLYLDHTLPAPVSGKIGRVVEGGQRRIFRRLSRRTGSPGLSALAPMLKPLKLP
jgi:hypothetical protein